MPTTWGYSTVGDQEHGHVVQSATITCPTCDEHVTLAASRASQQTGDEISLIDGRKVSEVFRFVSGRGRYTTSCRECERTARKRAANALSGAGRRFGVEIECNLPGGLGYGDLEDRLRDYGVDLSSWSVRGDGSLGPYGVELVSPPLQGESGHAEIRLVCEVLSDVGCTVDTRCGLHVHHDIRGASTTIQAVKTFVKTWAANQDLIDALVSTSRRESRTDYCKRLSTSELTALDAITDLSQLGSEVTHDRYKAVNVMSYPSHGTLEIRQHQGTIDATKISAWIRLGQAMLDDAEARRTHRQAAGSVQEMMERLGDRINENARTYLIGRAVELKHRGVKIMTDTPAFLDEREAVSAW